jgi:hypothetical protein
MLPVYLARAADPRYGLAVRRLGGLILVIAVLLGGRLFLRRPADVELDLALGDAAVRTATLVFADRNERVARELELRYPSGAPAHDRHSVRLVSGDYQVGVRLDYAGRPARTLTRELHVEGPGTYSLDLTP